uniref:glutamate--cysteine ligase catalytic subunit isoform X3 n=1 Tax=Ciona intestinalis TaxID=7719 RepID=UPI000EF47152|nr:glutamate--cysteine ligase catalytic subunit isoform X3 [Ciona intestinalis]|eukprot:XP_026693518.1 glutamate--cysteine ligase catalytic subunit isoform X3 [Ciona intestinalis]
MCLRVTKALCFNSISEKQMGFLDFNGEPLPFKEIRTHIDHVKRHGVLQFLNIYRRGKERNNDDFKWGDEIEYSVVHFDDEEKRARLSLRAEEILAALQEKYNEADIPICDPKLPEGASWGSHWNPEFSSFCLENSPDKPYHGSLEHLANVEANMRYRREQIKEFLNPDEMVLSLTGFPRLGCPDFLHPSTAVPNPIENPVSGSIFYPDAALSCHPRFPGMTESIRERRGCKVEINVPIFKDVNTKSPFIEVFNDNESNTAAKPDHVYMDATGFGLGQTCLQCTIQAKNLDEAKLLYDQLAPWCPIMIALSAASPFYRGYITDTDTRWGVISASCDDRNATERSTDLKPRHGPMELYLSPQYQKYNDLNSKMNKEAKNTLLKGGVEDGIANHIAHLWVRDPLNLYSGRINIDDETEADHFEYIQSTVWYSLRFKPPTPDNSIGWRIEFRVLDGQLTDFENAAYIVFVVLLTRVILAKHLDFTIPMSRITTNMKRAQKKNAVLSELFYSRKCIKNNKVENGKIKDSSTSRQNGWVEVDEEMTIDRFINGKEGLTGVIPVIREYLDETGIQTKARNVIERYLELISKRASGECLTAAQWKRHYVRSHPDYKQDSVVSQLTEYDLLKTCDKLEKGETYEHPVYLDVPHLNQNGA